MSWRDVARAAVQREAIDGGEGCAVEFGYNDNNAEAPALSEASDADLADALAEREAIAIMDGGLPPEWATSLSLLERWPKPAAISPQEWRRVKDALWMRAEQHGADFAANGWTFEEVFGVGETWLSFGERGAAWLALDARIESIDAERIVFLRGKQRSTHHRRPH